MRNIFFTAFIASLFVASIAHAEERIDPTWMRGGPGVMGTATPMGSGIPPMFGKPDHIIFSSTSMPMMGSGTPMCKKFSRGLALGLRGDDVKELQEMLREKGFLAASSTGYFGPMTKAAVMRFQKEGGITPTGYFGELSRKQHEKGCGGGLGIGNGGGTSTSSKPYPCPMMACKEGTECLPCGGKPIPPMGTTTWNPDDRLPIHCTMEARMCPDGTMMPRDNRCGWHPEKCGVLASTTISGTVSQ